MIGFVRVVGTIGAAFFLAGVVFTGTFVWRAAAIVVVCALIVTALEHYEETRR